MCLTIPAKVVKINGVFATVKDSNSIKEINLQAVTDVKVGDWILYANDFAVRKISSRDASEIIDLLENKHPVIQPEKLSEKYKKIILNSKKRALTKEEVIYLLETSGLEKEAMFAEADVIRKTFLKDFICIHGIIEFSNYCKNDCYYCGLRSENKDIKRYRMSADEIVEAAVEAVNVRGYKLLILQSGEDPFYTTEILSDIIRRIKENAQVFILISIGERDKKTYQELKKKGASGVLFRFETSNSGLFKKIHPNGKNWKRRFDHLKFLKELGYYIATGSIIGLPGQTIEDMANDLLIIKDWANMVSMGPFVPSLGTPFANEKPGDPDLNFKMISVLRIMMNKARIPVVTALETLVGEDGRKKGLLSGANSLMINLTPEKYRSEYKIYENRFFQANSLWEKYGLFREEESYQMIKERMEEELGDKILT